MSKAKKLNLLSSIAGITITENGTSGKGARFEITVPKGRYRSTGRKET